MLIAAENIAFLKLHYFSQEIYIFCFTIAHEAPGPELAKQMVAGSFS